MTESWQIAIMTIFAGIATGILGWIATTLTGIRKDLNKKVDKEDCDHDMDYHCKRLDALEKDVRANTTDIAAIKGQIIIKNNPSSLGYP